MYTMMQVCRELDMTYQTLKYYCNEGLVPHVKRDKNNRRIFDEHDLKWIKDLSCLKKCDFSIQEMKEYLKLCLEGEKTIPIRQEMLSKKRANLENTIKQLEKSMDYIDWKQSFYNDVLTGKRPYISNLINLDNKKGRFK
ncbi:MULTISPECIES: MerR family transcriptional regulator [Coprobacillaceae]|uniref:MerR family transcriptional regulator n=1 Tax=Coprobacillaceae TaxID=2810280 RepID=UPI000E478895|nr:MULTISPECIES: MerR family transcriptional regulator [Coprobacillaceae]RHM59874.1 MerR family transcriptional regulator [Coprobacillus sp. AF33-1AC]RHS95809.1 MerR family transcriptional regulator [Erysipelatoclostridium sp. AM42-17]